VFAVAFDLDVVFDFALVPDYSFSSLFTASCADGIPGLISNAFRYAFSAPF
jgi:hypothetical protein